MKKNKNKLISIIALSCVGVIVAGSIPLSAYVAYSNYKQNILDNMKKDDPDTPDEKPNKELVLVSIEAKLKEGVAYYDNKKAKPTTADFEVTAHYTKGEEKVDEEIFDGQYTMEVPDDFSLNGGKIKFTFNEKEATVNVTLTPVKLASILVIGDPYKVYYKNGETFDKTGITIVGINNDKSEIELVEDDIEASTEGLKVGQTEVEIHLKSDPSIKGAAKVSVVNEADFNDGNLLSIETVSGRACLNSGETDEKTDVSSLIILRKYESGNKYLSKGDNLEINPTGYVAQTGDKKIVNVKVKDTTISTDVPLYIKDGCNFDNPSLLKGVTVNKEDTFVIDEHGNSKVDGIKDVVNFSVSPEDKKEESITINLNSNSYSTGSLLLKVSNNTINSVDKNFISNELKVNEIFDLKVNGNKKILNASSVTKKVVSDAQDVASKTYTELIIKDINVNQGVNEIILNVNNFGTAQKLKVSDFAYISDGSTPNYSFLDYLEASENEKAEMNYSCVNPEAIQYRKVYTNTYTVLNDDNYIYALQSASWNGKKLVITKTNKKTLEIEKATKEIEYTDKDRYLESFNIFFNDKGNICYWDSIKNTAKIYDKDTLTELDETFSFETIEDNTQMKASYNKENETYVVLSNKTLKLFDKNGNLMYCTLNNKNVKVNWTYDNADETKKFTLSGITTYKDFIVVNSRARGKSFDNSPSHQIKMYDYDGNLLYETQNTFVGAVGNDNNGYALNYVFDKNDAYLVTNNWQKGFNLLKVSFTATFAKKFDLSSLGGYVEKAKFEEKTPAYTSKILNQDKPICYATKIDGKDTRFINIDSTINVGGQVFASYSNSGSKYGIIAKINLDKKSIIAQSEVITLGAKSIWTKSNTLFAKDGYIGLVNNRDYSITFYDTQTLTKVDRDVVTFTGLPTGTKLSYITYNDLNKKFALVDSNKNLYFADEFGRVTEKIAKLNVPQVDPEDANTKAYKPAQLTCDNGYVYMIYARDGDYNACLNIFDWKGNLIKDEKIALNGTIDAVGTDKGINVQAMVTHAGKLYISVLGFNGKGHFLYEVDFDTSIF